MRTSFRVFLLAFAVMTVTVSAGTPPAYAYFKHHHKHKKPAHHKHVKHVRHVKSDPLVRDAQARLAHLDFYTGKADGVMGPQTVKAIKAFQSAHNMAVTGKLTDDVYQELKRSDTSVVSESGAPVPLTPNPAPPPPIALPMATEKDTLHSQAGLVGPTNQQYADPLLAGPTVAGAKGNPQYARTQELSSRFAKLDVNENKNGPLRRYSMTVSGTPILEIEHQPSIIGISPTYNLNNEDGIILTQYVEDNDLCHYKHFLLLLTAGHQEMKEFGECTMGYSARKVDNVLFVTFPQFDDKRVAGATWRYDNGDLQKL